MPAFRSDKYRKPYSRPGADVDGMWQHDKAPETLFNSKNLPNQADPSTKLIVSNLHYEITPKDLTSIFGQMGTLVREPQIRYDRSGRSSGIASIWFETPAEATRAKNQFDGILAKGQPMSIAHDTSQPRRTALLHRIQKPPLLNRLSKNDGPVKTSFGPRVGPGPIRTRPGRGRASVHKMHKKTPKTVDDLDKELDAFMVDGKKETPPASAPSAAPLVEGDVEMT